MQLGQIVQTRGVNDKVAESLKYSEFVLNCLCRHTNGDWGDLCDEDKQANDYALRTGNHRILSSYTFRPDDTLWIITEWDRSVTTLLLPEEY
jgi:hypothetical protein